ncbi:MAG: hypothetical protein ABIJ18_01285 [archaeon]
MKNTRTEEICITQENFDEMEKSILNQVMKVSKAMLETFKFKMIYATKVSEEQNKKTLKALKEFRDKNWDKTLSRDEAYEKYISS